MKAAVKTLLMMAFEFPPLDRVSVHRSLMLAKYLPLDGIRPVVVTTDAASFENWFGPAAEDELLSALPPDVTIHRIACPAPRKRSPNSRLRNRLAHFFSVDEDIAGHWLPCLAKVWERILAECRPDALYVTIPPYSMATLAMNMARRSGLPLIVDFRDNWSHMCNAGRQTWLHYQLQRARERRVIEAAAAVVGVTEQLVRDLRAAHPHVAREKFHVVPNGFDRALSGNASLRAARREDSPFVIGYVGSFYYTPEGRSTVMEPWWRRAPKHWLHYSPRREDWLYRSPFFFFRALATLFASRPELRGRTRVRFVGRTADWLRAQVEQFGLADVVEYLGPLSHRDCLEFQAQCDALLVTSAKVVGGRDYCIAGKTFEYISSGRPIIAVVTEGEQRDFLLQSGTAVVCDADDPVASARALENLMSGEPALAPNMAFLERFDRRETSRKMARIVRDAANSRRCANAA